jgi:hypothetical protein
MTTTAPAAVPTDASEAGGALTSGRRTLVWALVGVASLIAVIAVLTTWVNRQMLSNESWTNASEQLIQDPTVQKALSVYIVNELYDNVDVSAQLERKLPPNLDPLAAPLAAALRGPAANGVNQLLARPRVQQLFVNTSSLAHEKLVNVHENTTGHGISTGDGVVTLDLGALVRDLGTELGVSTAALDRLPPDTGVVTVMRSDQLAAAQKGVRLIHALSAWLLVLVFGMYALALYLARGARRETLRTVGWALVLVGLIVLVAKRVVGNYAIGALSSPEYEPPTREAWLIASSILGQIGWAAVLYGACAILGAVIAGPTRAAVGARSRFGPVLNRRPGAAAAVTGTVFLLLVLWGGTHALRTWWGILLLGCLLAAGVVALRNQTLREFPDEDAPAPGGNGSGGVRAMFRPPGAAAGVASGTTTRDE